MFWPVSFRVAAAGQVDYVTGVPCARVGDVDGSAASDACLYAWAGLDACSGFAAVVAVPVLAVMLGHWGLPSDVWHVVVGWAPVSEDDADRGGDIQDGEEDAGEQHGTSEHAESPSTRPGLWCEVAVFRAYLYRRSFYAVKGGDSNRSLSACRAMPFASSFNADQPSHFAPQTWHSASVDS